MKKTAFITGATGGIGTEIIKKIITEGFYVIGTYYQQSLEEIDLWMKNNQISSDQISLIDLDVSDYPSCKTVMTGVTKDIQVIDVLINAAGITKDTVFKKMNESDWYDVINTNLNSLFNVTSQIFPGMLERQSGRIVNITSVNGLKGQFGQTNYSTAKAGMIGFTKSLALEGAKYGVTVNAIAPGYTATSMVSNIKPEILQSIEAEIPMKRLATPTEIADAVLFLIGDGSAYITGETLSVNGGLYMH